MTIMNTKNNNNNNNNSVQLEWYLLLCCTLLVMSSLCGLYKQDAFLVNFHPSMMMYHKDYFYLFITMLVQSKYYFIRSLVTHYQLLLLTTTATRSTGSSGFRCGGTGTNRLPTLVHILKNFYSSASIVCGGEIHSQSTTTYNELAYQLSLVPFSTSSNGHSRTRHDDDDLYNHMKSTTTTATTDRASRIRPNSTTVSTSESGDNDIISTNTNTITPLLYSSTLSQQQQQQQKQQKQQQEPLIAVVPSTTILESSETTTTTITITSTTKKMIKTKTGKNPRIHKNQNNHSSTKETNFEINNNNNNNNNDALFMSPGEPERIRMTTKTVRITKPPTTTIHKNHDPYHHDMIITPLQLASTNYQPIINDHPYYDSYNKNHLSKNSHNNSKYMNNNKQQQIQQHQQQQQQPHLYYNFFLSFFSFSSIYRTYFLSFPDQYVIQYIRIHLWFPFMDIIQNVSFMKNYHDHEQQQEQDEQQTQKEDTMRVTKTLYDDDTSTREQNKNVGYSNHHNSNNTKSNLNNKNNNNPNNNNNKNHSKRTSSTTGQSRTNENHIHPSHHQQQQQPAHVTASSSNNMTTNNKRGSRSLMNQHQTIGGSTSSSTTTTTAAGMDRTTNTNASSQSLSSSFFMIPFHPLREIIESIVPFYSTTIVQPMNSIYDEYFRTRIKFCKKLMIQWYHCSSSIRNCCDSGSSELFTYVPVCEHSILLLFIVLYVVGRWKLIYLGLPDTMYHIFMATPVTFVKELHSYATYGISLSQSLSSSNESSSSSDSWLLWGMEPLNINTYATNVLGTDSYGYDKTTTEDKGDGYYIYQRYDMKRLMNVGGLGLGGSPTYSSTTTMTQTLYPYMQPKGGQVFFILFSFSLLVSIFRFQRLVLPVPDFITGSSAIRDYEVTCQYETYYRDNDWKTRMVRTVQKLYNSIVTIISSTYQYKNHDTTTTNHHTNNKMENTGSSTHKQQQDNTGGGRGTVNVNTTTSTSSSGNHKKNHSHHRSQHHHRTSASSALSFKKLDSHFDHDTLAQFYFPISTKVFAPPHCNENSNDGENRATSRGSLPKNATTATISEFFHPTTSNENGRNKSGSTDRNLPALPLTNESIFHIFHSSTSTSSSLPPPRIQQPSCYTRSVIPYSERTRPLKLENKIFLTMEIILIRLLENIFICAIVPRTHYICRYTEHCSNHLSLSDLSYVLYPAGVNTANRQDAIQPWSSMESHTPSAIYVYISVVMITLHLLLAQALILKRTYYINLACIMSEWDKVDSKEIKRTNGVPKPRQLQESQEQTTPTQLIPQKWDATITYKKGDLVYYPSNDKPTLYETIRTYISKRLSPNQPILQQLPVQSGGEYDSQNKRHNSKNVFCATVDHPMGPPCCHRAKWNFIIQLLRTETGPLSRSKIMYLLIRSQLFVTTIVCCSYILDCITGTYHCPGFIFTVLANMIATYALMSTMINHKNLMGGKSTTLKR